MNFSLQSLGLRLALGSFLLFSTVHADQFYADYYPAAQDYCLAGCQTVLGYVTFNQSADALLEDYYTSTCSNTLQLQSIYLCGQAYCERSGVLHYIAQQNAQCQREAGISLPSFETFEVTPEELAKIPVVNESAATTSATAPLTYAVIPTRDWAEIGIRTTSSFYVSWNLGFNFSWACIGFWGLVLLIGIVHRGAELYRFSQASTDDRSTSLWLRIRRTLILPATFGKHCQQPIFGATIPPRLESILLFAYLIMNFIFMFPGYDLFSENIYWPETRLQLARYLSDRAGFLAIAQLPMVWLFATRNDPFLWLTGWTFATYNRFHRWIARIATAQAIIHSIGYTVYSFYYSPSGKNYRASWEEEYWYCGGIATIVMSVMLGLSAWWFREKSYDLFLVLHIVFAIVFLVTMFYHVKIFDGEFAGFLWPCVAFWCFDRLMRYAHIIYATVIPRFGKKITATTTYNPASDMIRLDISGFLSRTADIKPGHFYYLYTPATLRGWESHPFTLCSYVPESGSEASSPSAIAIEDKGFDAALMARASTSSATSSDALVHHSFLVRPYSGFTKDLKKKLLKRISAAGPEASQSPQDTPVTIPILLEGPYGSSVHLSRFSNVLVLAGGSGITAAVSHANFLLRQRPQSGTKVKVIWAVPQLALVEDVCAHELRGVLDHEDFEMHVYLTGEKGSTASVVDPTSIFASAYTLHHGRPDLMGSVHTYRETCTRGLAVVACGTPAMADVCRKAVVDVLAEPGVEVEFVNETMLW